MNASRPLRLVHIAWVVSRFLFTFLLERRVARFPSLAKRLPNHHLSRPERLKVLLEDLGGSFIKFGQMIALQPDVLKPEYCDALFDLMDRVAPIPERDVQVAARREFGKPPAQVFDEFSREPIATASIGQVHVAYKNGEKFAVKIQRPNIEDEFHGDISLMRVTLRLIRAFQLKTLYWLLEPLNEFITWTYEELDFRQEARYMDALRKNSLFNRNEHIPKVQWDLTSRRVLVSEFVEGVTILDYLRALQTNDTALLATLEDWQFDQNEFARNIIDNFLGDAFRFGTFHADMHPANLMIRPNNVVGYVDFGISGVISQYSRHNLVSLTLALARKDVDDMCTHFFNVSELSARSDLSGFRAQLRALSDTWYERRGQQRRLKKSVTQIMLDMLMISKSSNIWPEKDVVKYIRSAIAVDGLIKRFSPTFNVVGYLGMVCDHYLGWYNRRALFSHERIVSWFSANRQLMLNGSLTVLKVLDKVNKSRPFLEGIGQSRRTFTGELRFRVLFLSLLLLMVSFFLVTEPDPIRLGLNLATLEILGVVGTSFLMLKTYRQLAKG